MTEENIDPKPNTEKEPVEQEGAFDQDAFVDKLSSIIDSKITPLATELAHMKKSSKTVRSVAFRQKDVLDELVSRMVPKQEEEEKSVEVALDPEKWRLLPDEQKSAVFKHFAKKELPDDIDLTDDIVQAMLPFMSLGYSARDAYEISNDSPKSNTDNKPNSKPNILPKESEKGTPNIPTSKWNIFNNK